MTQRRTAFLALIALIAAILAAFIYRNNFSVESLASFVGDYGALAPLVFLVVRVLGAVVLIPGSVMALAAGIVFGFLPGAVYNLVASTLGAVVAFYVARYIAPDWVRQKIAGRGLLQPLVRGVEKEGWRFVAFVRLVPLFPYNVVNYAFGLTRIGIKDYTLATLVCMIPGDLAYVYLGYAGREAIAGNEKAWQLGLIALAGLATLAYIPRLMRLYSEIKIGK